LGGAALVVTGVRGVVQGDRGDLLPAQFGVVQGDPEGVDVEPERFAELGEFACAGQGGQGGEAEQGEGAVRPPPRAVTAASHAAAPAAPPAAASRKPRPRRVTRLLIVNSTVPPFPRVPRSLRGAFCGVLPRT
jgi:hypothetical protein